MTDRTVTVLTPSFNRAELLPRLFESLMAQSYRDFEWLVVDDGSTDGTQEVIAQLRDRAPFPVRYVYQRNGGKHVALNTGVAAAAGRYCAVIDSDDWYAPDALAVLAGEWDALATPLAFAEVQALCATAAGEIIGSRYPNGARIDSDAFEIYHRFGVRGDKIGMIRTAVMRDFPFPEDLGRSYVTESLVWFRIARHYKTRYLNQVLAYKEYLPGGITRLGPDEALARSLSRRVFFREMVQMRRPMPVRARLRAYANWVRNARLSEAPLREEFRQAPSRPLFLLAAPVGFALAVRDRRQTQHIALASPADR